MSQMSITEQNKEADRLHEEELATRMPRVGKTVVWHDAEGTPHDALVTAVWGRTCINVVFISSDENRQDNFGRQTERATSCQHKSLSQVHGFYWRFEDEKPNEYVAPLER